MVLLNGDYTVLHISSQPETMYIPQFLITNKYLMKETEPS